jgi:chaperone required for assembly of F1-ATPase
MSSASSTEGAARRFYKEAVVQDVDGGYTVALDGRAVKTPAKQLLVIAARELAEAVAEEWRAQEAKIRQETMPMMRFVCTTLDRVTPRRGEVVAETAKYGETDLLCYRVEAPDELALRQTAAWQPLLDWAAARYGAQLSVTTGITAIEQDAAHIGRLRAAVEAENDFTVTGLHFATAATGSLILALALLEREIDAEQAWAAGHVDERWQLDRWGADEELEDRLARLRREIAAAADFLALSR